MNQNSCEPSNVYDKFNDSINYYTSNDNIYYNYYNNVLCLKSITKNKTIDIDIDIYITYYISYFKIKSKVDIDNYINTIRKRMEYVKCCVLPKNHTGKCEINYEKIFVNKKYLYKIKNMFETKYNISIDNSIIEHKLKIIDKLNNSINLAIFNTPGNDDYIFKNRSNRLYPIILSKEDERILRDKNEKKKLAIPIKDASSPILLSQAYLDWLTFVLNIQDIKHDYQNLNIDDFMLDLDKIHSTYNNSNCLDNSQLYNHIIMFINTLYLDKSYIHYNSILNLIQLNQSNLIKYYHDTYQRKIFDDNNLNTICVITKIKLSIKDFVDIDRDNRIIINNNDVQLGHNLSRRDEYVSIRGLNLLPMTRRGNLLLGDYNFVDNDWIEELKTILSNY